MADATGTEVDGVEPTILIEVENGGGVRTRSGNLISVRVPTLVTQDDLADLGAFAWHYVEDNNDVKVVQTPSAPIEDNNDVKVVQTPSAPIEDNNDVKVVQTPSAPKQAESIFSRQIRPDSRASNKRPDKKGLSCLNRITHQGADLSA